MHMRHKNDYNNFYFDWQSRAPDLQRDIKVSAKFLQTTKFTKNTKEQPVKNKNKSFVKSFLRALRVLRGD